MRSLSPGQVVIRQELAAVGWSSGAIARAVRSGRLIRFHQGIYGAPPATGRLRAIAATRALNGAVLSHRSAAELHGLPLVGRSPKRSPQVTLATPNGYRIGDVHLHRAALDDRDVTCVNNAPVTSVARTLVDLGRSEPTHCAVAALDAALHRELANRSAIEDVLVRCSNWPGIRRAQRSYGLADARAESPLESVSRLVLERLDLPRPVLQLTVFSAEGWFVGRTDFGWPDLGVVGEADGLSKYDGATVLRAEKLRQERLEQVGLVVVRWGWTDITRRPRQVEVRLRQAFEQAAAARRSGIAPRWSVSAT